VQNKKGHNLKKRFIDLGKTTGDIVIFAGLTYATLKGLDYAYPEKMNEAIHNIRTPGALMTAGAIYAVCTKAIYDLSKFLIRDMYRTFKKSE